MACVGGGGGGARAGCARDERQLNPPRAPRQVKFGPANLTHPNGTCIAGGGRFPDLHGKNADAGYGSVPLVERLYAALTRRMRALGEAA